MKTRMKYIREGKASRMPVVPVEQTIFKCRYCGDHFYHSEQVQGDKTCKNCRVKIRSSKDDSSDQTQTFDGKEPDRTGHDLGNGFDPTSSGSGSSDSNL